jgi:hypothetical protein
MGRVKDSACLGIVAPAVHWTLKVPNPESSGLLP